MPYCKGRCSLQSRVQSRDPGIGLQRTDYTPGTPVDTPSSYTTRNPIGLAPIQNITRACARRCSRYAPSYHQHLASERRRDCAPVVLHRRRKCPSISLLRRRIRGGSNRIIKNTNIKTGDVMCAVHETYTK